MSQFVFVYRAATGGVHASFKEQNEAWSGWFDRHSASVVDPGLPVFERSSVGQVRPGTAVGGYSVVNADSLEAAIDLAKTSPARQFGGGVEVGVRADLPPEHGARRLKEKLAANA